MSVDDLYPELAKFEVLDPDNDAFQVIIDKVKNQFGTPRPLKEFPGVLSFNFTWDFSTEASFRQVHKDLIDAGYLIVRCKNFQNLSNVLLLFPTAEKYAVILALECDGSGQGEEAVIASLQAIEKTNPFILTDCANDMIAGYFTQPIKNPKQLAEQLTELCEDIDLGSSSLDDYAKELTEKKELYLWWD